MVGITKRVRSVPKLIPPTITQPISWRLSDPGPVASASGRAPKIVAMVVIKMGRNLRTAEAFAAS
jgi:hypothetical protein